MAAIGEVFQVRMVAFASALFQLGLNITHYITTAVAGSGATDTAIATAMDASWHVAYKAWMNNSVTYRGTGAKCIFPVQRLEAASIGFAGVGGGAVALLPSQLSGIIHFQTATAGRKGRGRVYPPFPDSGSNSTSGEMSNAGFALLQAIAAAIPQSIVVGVLPNQTTLQLAVWSKTAHTTIPITAKAAVPKWATQRRRGDFGRQNVLPW